MRIDLRLLDDDDWQRLETTLMRAMVRAFRVVAKENLISGYKPPPAEAVAEESPAEAEPIASPIAETPAPVSPPAPAPVPRHEQIKTKKQNNTLRRSVKIVDNRPHGFITEAEAIKLIGGTDNDRVVVRRWILGQEIPAVGVRNVKPPTKGLAGKLMVDKDAVIDRNQQRLSVLQKLASRPSQKRAA